MDEIKALLTEMGKALELKRRKLTLEVENWQGQMVPAQDEYNLDPDGKSNGRNYRIKSGDMTVTSWSMQTLPGCCGICLSNNAFVWGRYHGKGVNTIANKIRIAIAKQAGYGIILCTDRDENTAQRKTLARNGWTDIHQFENPRTGNLVNISIKNLENDREDRDEGDY